MTHISDDSRKDLDKVFASLLPFAQQMLAKRGAFHPFGAAMKTDGEIALMAGDPGEGEHPNSTAVMDVLVAGCRKQAQSGELRASGVCYDGRIQTSPNDGMQDAICVQLEHVTGGAIVVAVKYRKGFLGRYRYETPVASAAEARVFVPGSGANRS